MQYLRSGDWTLVTKIPVVASAKTLKRIDDFGWIERRSGGPRAEIKLTHAGLVALQARV
jgi:predicted transcriptional regulator